MTAILLDEMFGGRLYVLPLVEAGHDALSSHDRPGRKASDAAVLAVAIAESRVLVTGNTQDFRPMIAARQQRGEAVPIVVYVGHERFPRTNPHAIVQALRLLLSAPSFGGLPEYWLQPAR